MQDDIKPPATENPKQPEEQLAVHAPPTDGQSHNESVSTEESPTPPPSQVDEQVPPKVPQTPKLPETKNEQHLVPIILAIIILVSLAAVAIVSGNR